MNNSTNPRHKIFESFLVLTQLQENGDKLTELQRACNEGTNLALRSWFLLPDTITTSHLHILHTFQQFVEINEASKIYIGVGNVGNSNMANKMQMVQEMKGTLGTWRYFAFS